MFLGASLVAQTVKNLPAIQETQVQSLGWEEPLEYVCYLTSDRWHGNYWMRKVEIVTKQRSQDGMRSMIAFCKCTSLCVDICGHMCVFIHIICTVFRDRNQGADIAGLCEGNVRFYF